ncbi:MAG: iron-containing alcohol dehydrogenase, partial [Intestinibacter sp.]
IAVLDPRMTMKLPPKMTAATGMDALCHAIESYTCMQKNPLSDSYAVAAINLIRENLLKVCENGNNKKGRLALANASLMAGVAFSNSMVGIIHAIGHALGGVSRVPHGEAMAILMPYCMEYNMDKLEELYAELLLPIAGAEVYSNTPKEERAKKTIETIKNMRKQLHDMTGLPLNLREKQVNKEDFEKIAQTALNDGAMIVNPKKVEMEDVIMILNQAY